MNKAAMSSFRKPAQSGFTLIELIVVIVILGILAATALPRFSSLSGDARLASLNAARGALLSTSAMVHGQALINPTATSVSYEGTQINIVNGYAAATANTATAAGLTNTDYTVTVNSGSSAQAAAGNLPTIPANSFVAQPVSVAGNTTGTTCYLTYTQATATVPASVTVTGTTAACN